MRCVPAEEEPMHYTSGLGDVYNVPIEIRGMHLRTETTGKEAAKGGW